MVQLNLFNKDLGITIGTWSFKARRLNICCCFSNRDLSIVRYVVGSSRRAS